MFPTKICSNLKTPNPKTLKVGCYIYIYIYMALLTLAALPAVDVFEVPADFGILNPAGGRVAGG